MKKKDGLLSDAEFCVAVISVLVGRLGGEVAITNQEFSDIVGIVLSEKLDDGKVKLFFNSN